MTWNYRVVMDKFLDTRKSLGTNVINMTFSIREVYYDENGDPEYCTEGNCCPFGETEEELKRDFENMRDAFELPVLDIDIFDKKE